MFGKALFFGGLILAAIGAGQCAYVVVTEGTSGAPNEGVQMAAIILNLVIFILPGFVLAGIGKLIMAREKD